MLATIGSITFEHQRTLPQVVLLVDFHKLYTLLYKLNISCLEPDHREVKKRYSEALHAYATHNVGRPLEKPNLFFEGVQRKIARGVKKEEVGYQLAFSKQELRKVIKENAAHQVNRGLEAM
nr:exocyst complex component 1-like [Dermacentor andersoni]